MNQDKLVIIHNFPIWLPQTQTWMYTQVKYLSGLADVHVVCERTQHLDQFTLPHIHCLSTSSGLLYFSERVIRKTISPFYRGYLKSVAKEINAQILHSHFGPIGWADTEVAKKMKMKQVVTFYGYDVKMTPASDQRWLARYQKLFADADLFLCEGPHMGRELVELGCPQEKIKVHHLGIDIDAIPYRPRVWHDGDPLRVLIAASFREKKGIPYAIQALSQLQDDVPLEITIIGDADAEERSQREKHLILKAIEEGDVKSKTRLLGYQPYSRLFQEAYNHHVFISPSVTATDGDTEGGAPIALIEMMASGMPVVSTLHCDIPEVVQYGVKNWLVQERNVAGLVDRLQWLLQHPHDWDHLLRVGRKHVVEQFHAVQQGQNLMKIYEELAYGKSSK